MNILIMVQKRVPLLLMPFALISMLADLLLGTLCVAGGVTVVGTGGLVYAHSRYKKHSRDALLRIRNGEVTEGVTYLERGFWKVAVSAFPTSMNKIKD